jgi:SAM-dependent methyltransferase
MTLPFDDETFDAVVCQFGAMFFPDKPKAFAEARRVLRPGGVFIFSVWDGIAENEFADTITKSLEELFPDDPPRFLARTPYGYHDTEVIARDVAGGGFSYPAQIDTITARSRAKSPTIPAIAFCKGSPLRNEIEARDVARLEEATEIAAKALAQKYGADAIDGKIQAHVITALN